MQQFRRFLASFPAHKFSGWLGVLVYACCATFPHQWVQDIAAHLAERYTLKRLYQGSVALAALEAVTLTILFILFIRRLPSRVERRWLTGFWLLCFALMAATWRILMANNTELIHYPQYFPEGVMLLALTLSPAESLAWIALLGGLDETFQYVFLMRGRAAPLDFNDIYMDLIGGAAGVIFAMAVLGCHRQPADKLWLKKILRSTSVVVVFSILIATLALLASGKVTLYDAPGSSGSWFTLSRLHTPTFWYFSPVILGPHHFHEMSPLEGVVLILTTIGFFSWLDRDLRINRAVTSRAQTEIQWERK